MCSKHITKRKKLSSKKSEKANYWHKDLIQKNEKMEKVPPDIFRQDELSETVRGFSCQKSQIKRCYEKCKGLSCNSVAVYFEPIPFI